MPTPHLDKLRALGRDHLDAAVAAYAEAAADSPQAARALRRLRTAVETEEGLAKRANGRGLDDGSGAHGAGGG